MGTLAKIGIGGFVGLGTAAAGAAVAAGAFGVKVASGNEQAKISFTTMLGSAKRADKFLRQLQQFAAKTPFEFPELQTAASSLISVGIKADKIIPIMTSLGNATAGMGTGAEGVKRATVALQQMTAAGRITAEDLNQLRDAGVPVFELLTKATGKSTAEIAKMAANGKLGRKELEQLMAALESGKGLERFAGLMDKQSRSLAGLWSTFKDTAGQALAGVATTAFPLMKSGLAAISTGLSHVSDWVVKNKGSLGTVFSTVGSTLSTLGKTVGVVFGSIVQSVSSGKASFKTFADFLATHQEDITAGIITGGKAFVGFGKVLAQVASAGLKAFAFLAEGQARSFELMLGGFSMITRGAALAFGWVPGLGPKFKQADAMFRGFAAGAVDGLRGAAAGAKGLAAGIDGKLLPGLNKAGQSLDALGKKEIASAHNRDIMAKAENRHRDALVSAEKAAKSNGKTLDANTISGRSNRTALNGLVSSSQNYISKLAATNAGSKRVTDATKTARAEFIRVATSMGVSSARAKDLADKYFKVPKKVKTDVTQPGMDRARNQTKGLDSDINGLNSKHVTVGITVNSTLDKLNRAAVRQFGKGAFKLSVAAGGVLPGYTPGRDVHRFYSPTGGQLELSGGEAIMRPEWTRAVGGPAAVKRMNVAARRGQAFAGGGVVSRKITEAVNARGTTYNYAKLRDFVAGETSAAVRAGTTAAVRQGTRAAVAAGVAAAKKAAAQATSSASGSVAGYSAGMAGTIARMRAAGARSFTTYPGHHPSMGKARDVTPHNWKIANVARASRSVWYVIYRMKIASKNHGNNWRPYHPISNRGDFRHTRHIHVAWYGAGTRRARGGLAVVGERGPELVRMRGGEQVTPLARSSYARAGSGGGVGNITYNVTINAPNYLGSNSDFKRELVGMARRGELDVIIKRAGGN